MSVKQKRPVRVINVDSLFMSVEIKKTADSKQRKEILFKCLVRQINDKKNKTCDSYEQ